MCERLYNILNRRFDNQDKKKTLNILAQYFDRKSREWIGKQFKPKPDHAVFVQKGVCRIFSVSRPAAFWGVIAGSGQCANWLYSAHPWS
ncbi:MAG: hypothetical protein R2861_03520 [Desulfobacterales bacterium]